MNFLKRFCIALAFCLAGSISVWGQSASVVYVATGDTQVYAVTTYGSATVTPLISAKAYRKATFNSLTVGPDNTGDFSVDSQGNYNFFLYACDNNTDNIIRFEFSTSAPSTPIGSSVLVTTAIPSPVCGRVGSNVEVKSVSLATYATKTKSGNLYVSSGSDVYEIRDASSTPNDGTFIVASSPVITSTESSLGGMTQKNSGDLLVVGSAGSVLRAEYLGGTGTSPFQNTFSAYITDTSDLTNPVGIARAQALEQSDSQAVINDFFVTNSVSGGGSAVYGFDPSDSLTNPFCSYSGFSGDQTPTSIAGSEDNFLYVGVTSSDTSEWGVQTLTAGCQSTGSFISLTALSTQKLSKTGPSAVAVPPVPEAPAYTSPLTLDPSSDALVRRYNFGSSLLQLAPGSCTIADVEQTPMPLSVLQELTNNKVSVTTSTSGGPTWYGAAPAAGIGEGGFGTVYSFTPSSNCSLEQAETTILVGGFFDSSVTNPRIVHCDDAYGTCNLVDPSGDWPEGGYLPNDSGTYGGKTPTFGSKYFVVNGNLTPNKSDQATFCGLESPLIDAASPSDQMAEFSPGQGLSVKFKLGESDVAGSCRNGPYVTDAYALLSIVQIQNGQGETVFQPIQINTQGNSTDNPPIFKWNSSSQNYEYSLSLANYESGIYELTITFLTNNGPTVIRYFQVQ